LQQTRVNQGLPYYLNFVEKYPTVHHLARAAQTEVLKLWEGLGYYSRARNLHACAQMVVDQYGGEFPDHYTELLKLKGVGPYTAAAIASIAFAEPVPVIDGNVFRLISRLFGITEDISVPKTRKTFEEVLIQLIPSQRPGDFNQAVMEFGALVCTPQNPQCDRCVLRPYCHAYAEGLQSNLPVKKKKLKKRDRYFHYLVLELDGKLAMKKRDSGDVWQGLYDFLLIETQSTKMPPALLDGMKAQIKAVSPVYKHLLTHQNIFACFYHITLNSIPKVLMDKHDLHLYSMNEVVNLPKPKLVINYLHKADF
jgi:A/G-specific adenine glycosylase